MTLGIALILIFVLYLIDKHNRWRQAFKITVGLVILGILGVGGIFGWQKYETWQEGKREALGVAEEAKQIAQKQAELAKTCKSWEEKHPVGSALDKIYPKHDGTRKPDAFVLDAPQGCEGPLETDYSNSVAAWVALNNHSESPAPHKHFGNGHVAPDSAIVFKGGTMITTVYFGSRVKVLGEDALGYDVQLADGRTGYLSKEEVELDEGVVVESKTR
jgi:hypothetical protein